MMFVFDEMKGDPMSGGAYYVGGIELSHLAPGTAPDDVLRSLGYQMANFMLYGDARVALQEALSQGKPSELPPIEVQESGNPNTPPDPHNPVTLNAGTFHGVPVVVTIPAASWHPSTVSGVRDSSICIALQVVVDGMANPTLRTGLQSIVQQNLQFIVQRFAVDAQYPWW